MSYKIQSGVSIFRIVGAVLRSTSEYSNSSQRKRSSCLLEDDA